MRRPSALLLLPVSLALLGAVAAPKTDAPAPKTVVVKAVDVSATEYKWLPAEISVNPGDTVRFQQTTAMPHNVQFKDAPAGASLGDALMGPFMSQPGETYDVVIDGRFKAGKYAFVCTPHEAMGMKGSITVAGK